MELALVFVFLLLPLLVGVADVARAYFEHLAVVNSANVAARWATLNGTEQYCSGFASVPTVVAANLGDLPVQIQAVSTSNVIASPGPMVQVSVTYSHSLLFGVVDGSIAFTGASSMPGTASTPVACLSCCPTPLPTATATPTGLPTATSTNTPTSTATRTATNTPTGTSTATPTSTLTPTRTATRTNTPLPATFTPTATATATATNTPTRSPTVTATPTPTPDFTLSVTPASQSAPAGSTVTFTVNLTSINNFAGTVTLSATTDSAVSSATFAPSSVVLTAGGNGSSTLTIKMKSNPMSGNHTVTVTGTSGTLNHSQNVTLVVP